MTYTRTAMTVGLLLAVMALAGCGGPGPVTAGTVIARHYIPPKDWDTLETVSHPIYRSRTVTRTRSSTSCYGSGATRRCSTSYTSYPSTQTYVAGYWYSHYTAHHHSNAEWNVKLQECKTKDGEKKCRASWQSIDQVVWRGIKVGQFFDTKV